MLYFDKIYKFVRDTTCISIFIRVAQNKVFWETLTSPHELMMLLGQYGRKNYFFENFQNLRGPTENSIFPIVTWWGGLKKSRRMPKPKRNFLYSHYRCCYPKTKVFSLPEFNLSEKAFSGIYHMENIMGGRWDPLNFEKFQKNIFSFNIVPKGTTIHVGRSKNLILSHPNFHGFFFQSDVG